MEDRYLTSPGERRSLWDLHAETSESKTELLSDQAGDREGLWKT